MNLIKRLYTREELLSLKVYEKCLKITQNEGNEELYKLIEYLSNQYIENNYEYNIFYSFYRLNDEINNTLEIGYSYNGMNEDQIIKNVKDYAEIVLSKFNFYREDEDWISFLTDMSYDDFNYAKKQKEKSNTYILKKEKVNNSFYDIILNFFGLK